MSSLVMEAVREMVNRVEKEVDPLEEKLTKPKQLNMRVEPLFWRVLEIIAEEADLPITTVGSRIQEAALTEYAIQKGWMNENGKEFTQQFTRETIKAWGGKVIE